MNDLKELLTQVEAIALEAGQAIMAVYAREFSVEEKADKSPLTEADKAAHDVIMRGLQSLSVQIPILSEEDADGFAGVDAEGRYWLVDPLDGTKEFIKRNGEFTVNIALIEAGEPILGVVYAPVPEVVYSAAKGRGAFKRSAGSTTREPIQVNAELPASWRVVGSRSHAGEETEAWLERLGEHERVPMGSSLKLCLVAEGRADVYPRLGPTCLWDTAAAHAVVNEAGGVVVTLEGQVLSYMQPGEILNPYFLVCHPAHLRKLLGLDS